MTEQEIFRRQQEKAQASLESLMPPPGVPIELWANRDSMRIVSPDKCRFIPVDRRFVFPAESSAARMLCYHRSISAALFPAVMGEVMEDAYSEVYMRYEGFKYGPQAPQFGMFVGQCPKCLSVYYSGLMLGSSPVVLEHL